MLIKLNDTFTKSKGDALTPGDVYDALNPVWNKDVERLIVTYTVGPKSVLETNGCDVRLLGYSSDGYITFVKVIDNLDSSRWPKERIDIRRVRDVKIVPKGGTAIYVIKNGKEYLCR